MSATVGSLNVEVNLQLAKMQAQFDTLNSTVKSHTAAMRSEFRALGDSVKGFFADMIPAVGAASIAEFTRSIVESGAAIEHSADAARMSAESFQVLNNLARDSGLGAEQLTRALDAMEKKIADANQGVKSAQKPFQDLGLDWARLAGMEPDRQFEALARAVLSAKDQGAAFAEVLDIVGTKGGPKLIEVLKRIGTEGLDVMAEKAKAAGQVLSNSVVAELDLLDRKSVSLTTRFKNMFSIMAADLSAGMGHSVTDLTLQLDNAKEALANLRQSDPGNAKYIQNDVDEVARLQAELDKVTAAQAQQTAAVEAAAAAYRKTQEAEADAAAAAQKHAAEYLAADAADNHEMMQRIKDKAAELKRAEEVRGAALQAEAAEGYAMWEKTRTPAEQYKNLLAEISKLEKDGFLDPDAAARARKSAFNDYQAGGEEKLRQLQKEASIAMASPQMPTGGSSVEQARELTVEIDRLKKALEDLKQAQGDHAAPIAAGEANLKLLEQQYTATEKLVEEQKRAKREADELAHSIASTFVDGVEKGEKFRQILRQIGDDMLKMAIQGNIEKPLESALSGAISGGGSGSKGSASGGIMSALLGAVFGFRASGGPVDAGKPYVVGEQGPEVIVPGSSGNVIPNGALGGTGGSVSFTNNFGGGVSRQDLADMVPMLIQQQKAALLDAARRGGPVAATLGTS